MVQILKMHQRCVKVMAFSHFSFNAHTSLWCLWQRWWNGEVLLPWLDSTSYKVFHVSPYEPRPQISCTSALLSKKRILVNPALFRFGNSHIKQRMCISQLSDTRTAGWRDVPCTHRPFNLFYYLPCQLTCVSTSSPHSISVLSCMTQMNDKVHQSRLESCVKRFYRIIVLLPQHVKSP